MRQDRDLDEGVARPPAPGPALPLEPQGLAVLGTLGDGDVNGTAVGERDALFAAADRIDEVNFDLGPNVRAALCEPAEAARAAPSTTTGAATSEHLAEDIAQVPTFEGFRAGPTARRAAAGCPPGARTTEPAAGFAAVVVQFARVEFLSFGRIADDVEGRTDLLKTFLGGFVAGVGVGVICLGQLVERLAHLR